MVGTSTYPAAVVRHHKVYPGITCACGEIMVVDHCCEFLGGCCGGLVVEDCGFDEDTGEGCMVCLERVRYNKHLAATYYDREKRANCCGRCTEDLKICKCSGFVAEDGHVRCKNCRGLWDDSRCVMRGDCLFCGFDGIECLKSGFLASDGEMRCARCRELWEAVCTRCGSASGSRVNEDGDEVCDVCRWSWNGLACRLCRYRGGKLHINSCRLYGFSC